VKREKNLCILFCIPEVRNWAFFSPNGYKTLKSAVHPSPCWAARFMRKSLVINALYFQGYSISCRRGRGDLRWHASVRIERRTYAKLKCQLQAQATRLTVEELVSQLRALPFAPYAPVRHQLWAIVRAINRRRKAAGIEMLPRNAVIGSRRVVRPFDLGPA